MSVLSVHDDVPTRILAISNSPASYLGVHLSTTSMIGAITGPAVVLPRRSIFESRRQNGAAVRSHAYHGVMSIVYPLWPSGNAFIVLPSGNAFIVLPSGNAFIDATAIV